MCYDCDEYDPYDDDFPDDYIDEDVAREFEIKTEATLDLTTIRFIKDLLDGQSSAVEHAASFYIYKEPEAPVAAPSYVVHTIWTGQEIEGFHRYTVRHDLDTWMVKTSLDTNSMFRTKVVDPNTIEITSLDDLTGVDVTVKKDLL